MSYIYFNGLVKSVASKKDGVKLITLEVSDGSLRGKVDMLDEMVGCKVEAKFDSQIVTYRRLLDARNDKPLRQFTADEHGVVTEIKPTGEQLEMNLEGVPTEKVPIKEESVEIERSIIDEFILSGLAPAFDDLQIDFVAITQRLVDGDSYLTIAKILQMSEEVLVEMLDEYRRRIAPHANAWDDWRNGKLKPTKQAAPEQGDPDEPDADDEQAAAEAANDGDAGASGDAKDAAAGEGEQPADSGSADGDTPTEMQFEGGEPPAAATPIGDPDDPKAVEAYILEHRPSFPDITFDIPALLEKKKAENLTWVEMATHAKAPSSQLQAAYAKYKEKVREQMRGKGAA